MTPWSQDIYTRAYHFAVRAHDGQTLPGTNLPYIIHVSLVSMEIMAALFETQSCEGDLAVQCALLHDTIEDTRVEFEGLRSEFGPAVARGVLALTKDKRLAKQDRMTDSLKRIKESPREIWMVKLADRIVNMQQPPPHWTKAKQCRYRKEAGMILDTLAAGSSFLARRLEFKIKNYPPE